MSILTISEVFGYGVDDLSSGAEATRAVKACPFRGTKCTKSSVKNPLGVCSLSNGTHATAVCPVRFLEKKRLFIDAAKIAFGTGVQFAPVPEFRILKTAGGTRIGKVDYLLARLNGGSIPIDFAALEVQAVYFSGESIRPAFNHFLQKKKLDMAISSRRPDYRSSAQKRLVPQLQLKVPVFRRWGKKFLVVVDSLFFQELPSFRRVTAGNAEITWLSYPIMKQGYVYSMGDPEIVHSVWDDIVTALREGEAPQPEELITELGSKIRLADILTT